MKKPIVILGCTASGKSDLAEGLAVRLGSQNGGDAEPPAGDGGRFDAGVSGDGYRNREAFGGGAGRDSLFDGGCGGSLGGVFGATAVCRGARTLLGKRKRETQIAKQGEADEGVGTTSKRPMILVAGTILYLRSLIEGLFEGPSADEASASGTGGAGAH